VSRIDELIAEMCPNGVPYEPLQHVARIRNGKDYKSLEAGDVPVFGSGGVMTMVDTAAHPGPSVLIPRKGSLNKLYYVDVPFWTVDTIFYTEIDVTRMVPKFLYCFLATQRLEELNQAGGVPSLTQSVLNVLRIPVPPLEVQREIVRVLDTFTQLEAELEAELEARRRQYAHYRDSLLTFPEGGSGGRRWVRSVWRYRLVAPPSQADATTTKGAGFRGCAPTRCASWTSAIRRCASPMRGCATRQPGGFRRIA
jgi:type I restriction enzyme S subunit